MHVEVLALKCATLLAMLAPAWPPPDSSLPFGFRSSMSPVIPTRIIPSVAPAPIAPKRARQELFELIEAGAPVRAVGEAKEDPLGLLVEPYPPRYKIELFDTRFYIAEVKQNPALRFLVAYVVQERRGRAEIHPRIFYKDLSLVWRCASHLIAHEDEFWIGKGDVRPIPGDDDRVESSESTTDLPLEMQTALETLNRKVKKVGFDEEAIYLVLRNAPKGRILPYRDFTEPRRRAAQNSKNLVHGGRRIAWFTRKNDPRSLKIVGGFEPDFRHGIIEESPGRSTLYGGALRRFRILSRNKKIQYIFIAAPKHVWIIPPQALTTELSTYGLRTVDVVADEDLFCPGFEYHYFDEAVDPSEHFSQIPEGYAGAPNEHDPERADTSRWLNKIPVIRRFREEIPK